MRRAWVLLLLLLAGCHRATAREPAAPALALEGKVLALWPSARLRLVVEGQLGGQPVPVALDVARPLSTVSAACHGEALPPPAGVAEVPEPTGGTTLWPLVRVAGLTLGGTALGSLRMGLTRERTCAATLGLDVLGAYALTVDPLRREVAFARSRPRAVYAAEQGSSSEPVHVLELSRDPLGDWPLVVARVVQGEAQLTGPFLLGSREPSSWLALEPAQAQGLQPLPAEAGVARALVAQAVELAEGLGVGPVQLECGVGWRQASTLGRLGPDVWGRFHTTLDVQGQALVLRRLQGPAPAEAGTAPPGPPAAPRPVVPRRLAPPPPPPSERAQEPQDPS